MKIWHDDCVYRGAGRGGAADVHEGHVPGAAAGPGRCGLGRSQRDAAALGVEPALPQGGCAVPERSRAGQEAAGVNAGPTHQHRA